MAVGFGLIMIFGMIVVTGAGCLMLGIILVFSFYDHIATRVRRSVHQLFPPPVPVVESKPVKAGSTIAALTWSLLPSTAVLAIFVGLSGAANREWDQIIALGRLPSPPVAVKPIESNVEQNVSLQKKLKEQTESIPKWAKSGDLIEGDVQKIVLFSRLWSTEAEAFQDVQNQTIERIRADFQQRYPGILDPKVFKVDKVIKTMVKQIHLEEIEQDFGKFTAPMYRAWWQIEISPIVRTEFYPQWKFAALQNRIIVVGVVFSLVTLIGSSVELFARLKRGTASRVIRRLAICAVPIVLWTVFELLPAVRLMS